MPQSWPLGVGSGFKPSGPWELAVVLAPAVHRGHWEKSGAARRHRPGRPRDAIYGGRKGVVWWAALKLHQNRKQIGDYPMGVVCWDQVST